MHLFNKINKNKNKENDEISIIKISKTIQKKQKNTNINITKTIIDTPSSYKNNNQLPLTAYESYCKNSKLEESEDDISDEYSY